MMTMQASTADITIPAVKLDVPAVISPSRHNATLEKPFQMAFKRFFDIVVSLSALIVLAPLFALIIIAIRQDSEGRALFTQARWGKDGKVIRIYKFRSMRSDLCDVTGVNQTRENDPRVTRVGAILRKTNLDELPQLINILKGDMSLVGPRCHALGMQAAGQLYEDLVPEYHERHVVRPGLTGLAQMHGFRGPTDTDFKARTRVAYDLQYISNFSIALDMKILFGTLVNEIRGGTGF